MHNQIHHETNGDKAMPIYEFYCHRCNMIMSFYARKHGVTKSPKCPHCGDKNLTRIVSTFATLRADRQKHSEDVDFPLNEAKMEKAIESLAREAETIDEDNPREAARVIKNFTKTAGLELGESMQTALQRMEAGEDPEKIEEEMGSILEEEEPFILPDQKTRTSYSTKANKRKTLRRDPKLYEL